MTWPLPDPAELFGRYVAELEAAFGADQVDPRAPESVLGAIGRAQALMTFEQHLYLRYQAAELMPDTAVDLLERHADVWGVTRLPAAVAGGNVTFSGIAGTVIPAATELRSPGGVSVMTSAGATIGVGGTVTVAVTASVAGAAGSLAGSTALTLVSPIAGLTTQGAVVAVAGLTSPEGRDRESDEALRVRLLERIRRPPNGGSASDYVAWAKTVAGVERVAVVPGWSGPGSVGVVVAMTGGAVPDSGDLAAVAAVIDPLRPVTAEVNVVAVSLVVTEIIIQLTPDTAPIRATVEAAMDLYFAGLAIGEVAYPSRLSEAISSAGGEYAHAVYMDIFDTGAGEIYQTAPGELIVKGAVTWGGPVPTWP